MILKSGGHLTRRLALELLQQVRNPHTPQRSDSLSEADEELAIGAAPQRIASRRTKSEVFSKFLGNCSVIVRIRIAICALSEDDMVLDSGASVTSAAAEEIWPNSNGAANHYDVASAWMDTDAATEELHRYSDAFLFNNFKSECGVVIL